MWGAVNFGYYDIPPSKEKIVTESEVSLLSKVLIVLSKETDSRSFVNFKSVLRPRVLLYTPENYSFQAKLEICQAAPPGFEPGTFCIPVP